MHFDLLLLPKQLARIFQIIYIILLFGLLSKENITNIIRKGCDNQQSPII